VLDEGGYDYCATSNNGIDKRKNRLALLRVCREIHKETKLLPFSLNQFHFDDFYKFHAFMIRLPTTKRQAIRAVRIIMNLHIKEIFEDLRACGLSSLSDVLPGLQSVQVIVDDFAYCLTEKNMRKVGPWVYCGHDKGAVTELHFL
jgi:hypothetical protein